MSRLEEIVLIVVASVSVVSLAVFLTLVFHAETMSKSLMLKELGIKASYWESAGLSRTFIEGRLVERGAKCSNKN